MSAAEELRRAAEVLRERGGAATPGPWETYALPDESPNEWTMAGVGQVDNEMGHRTETMFKDDANYIATVSPDVGLLLADWLDSHAAAHEVHDPRALAVARAINRDAP